MAQEPGQNAHLPIAESDLKGACYRLNRRFSLIEGKVFGEAPGGPVRPNPVNVENINLSPGGTDPALPPSPAITYGLHDLRISDYVPEIHLGELFIESDRGNAVYQSQMVGSVAQWVLVP